MLAIALAGYPAAAEDARAPAGQDNAGGLERELAADLRRDLDRASRAVPRRTWTASQECREAARPAFKKACAKVVELRASIEALEAQVRTSAPPALPAAPPRDPTAAEAPSLGLLGWVYVGVLIMIFLASTLSPIWIGIQPRGDADGVHATRRVGPRAGHSQPQPSAHDAPHPKPVRRQTDGGDPDQGLALAPRSGDGASNAPRHPGAVRTEDCVPDAPSWLNPEVTLPEAVEYWLAERVAWDIDSRIAARAAFADFCSWCARNELRPPSETAFGLTFTLLIEDHGGRKVKRRERAYYVGCRFRNDTAGPEV